MDADITEKFVSELHKAGTGTLMKISHKGAGNRPDPSWAADDQISGEEV